jgi:hypothetical protein
VARGDPGEELEVVLEDQGMDGLGGHVDHASLGIPEADEQEEEPLLVERRGLELRELRLIQGEGRNHDGGVGLLLPGGQRAPEIQQTRLQPLELGDLLLRSQVSREGRLGDHGGILVAAGARVSTTRQ